MWSLVAFKEMNEGGTEWGRFKAGIHKWPRRYGYVGTENRHGGTGRLNCGFHPLPVLAALVYTLVALAEAPQLGAPG